MTTIVQALGYADGTAIDEIQGKLTNVFPLKPTARGSVQNAELSDVGGNKIKLTVWDHQDLAPHKGRDIYLHAYKPNPKYPAIKVVHGSYVASKDGRGHKAGDTVKTIELSLSKNAVLQYVEVAHQKPIEDKPIDIGDACEIRVTDEGKSVDAPKVSHIQGMTVGMALNNAVQILKHNGPIDLGTLPKQLYSIASDIIRVSQHIEKGNLSPKAEKITAEKSVEILEKAKAGYAPASKEELDDEPPF